MKQFVLFALFCALLLLVSCSPVEQECEKPFILKDGQCCLDLDDDDSCDAEQNATEEKIGEISQEYFSLNFRRKFAKNIMYIRHK